MTSRPFSFLRRNGGTRYRAAIILTAAVLLFGTFFVGCEKEQNPEPQRQEEKPPHEATIVAVGDSLTAGYGVGAEDAYPARLEEMLRKNGRSWRVVNAGVSGETSSGTLSRIAWVLKLEPDVVILETGANDGLRGIDPQLTRRNIDETVRILKQSDVEVVLAGMQMVTNLGREYTGEFAAIYPALAEKHDLVLIPFFLEGVAGEPSLNQRDGIHPSAEGYRIVAEGAYPYLIEALEKRQGPVELP